MAVDWSKTEELKITRDLLDMLHGRDGAATLNALLAVLATKLTMVSSEETIKDNLDITVASLRDRVDVCVKEKVQIDKERN